MAANPMIVPAEERYPGLRETLFRFVDQTAAMRAKHAELRQQPFPFLSLAAPWIVQEGLDPVQQDWFARRKIELEGLGFDGVAVSQSLTAILAADKHLRECCPSPLHLAHFLDSSFVTRTAELKSKNTEQRILDLVFEEFVSVTYHQGRFKRMALSHLFNFEMDGNSLR